MLNEQQIQQIIDYFYNKTKYKFKNPGLLIQALTRKSAKGIHVAMDASDFESLEFIGDRVLNLAITTHLCELYPEAGPGELQRYYEAYTRNTDASKRNGGPLYRVAKELGLEAFILKADSEDLEKNGLRGKIAPGKKSKEGHLSDHLEAFMGALYQDSQHDMELILAFVQQYWQYMGLNDDGISESSFGDSSISTTAAMVQKRIKHDAILLQAATIGNLQNVKIALERGASITAEDDNGQNALHHFAGYGNTQAIIFILSTLELDVDAVDKRGFPALLYAVNKGTPEAIEALLAAGASVNIEVEIDNVIITPLSLVAIKGHTHLIVLLLKYGWHAISNEQIQDAIVQAKEAKRNNVESILLKAKGVKSENQRLFLAIETMLAHPSAQDLAVGVIKKSITDGANIYARNMQGHTVFNLLKLMPVEIRFNLLGFILDKKLKLDEIDLTGMSTGAALSDAKIVLPVYQQLLALKTVYQAHDDNRILIDRWITDLQAEDDTVDRSLLSHMALLTIGQKKLSTQSPPTGSLYADTWKQTPLIGSSAGTSSNSGHKSEKTPYVLKPKS